MQRHTYYFYNKARNTVSKEFDINSFSNIENHALEFFNTSVGLGECGKDDLIQVIISGHVQGTYYRGKSIQDGSFFTKYSFYNKTKFLKSVIDYKSTVVTKEEIKKFLVETILKLHRWDKEDIIDVICSDDKRNSYAYMGGILVEKYKEITDSEIEDKVISKIEDKIEDKVIDTTTDITGSKYSFIRITDDDHIQVSDYNLFGTSSSVYTNFHLLPLKDKIFLFHFVIILNMWNKSDDVRAISSSQIEPTFYYKDDEVIEK